MYDFFFRGAGCGHKHLRLKDFKVPTIKPTFPDKKNPANLLIFGTRLYFCDQCFGTEVLNNTRGRNYDMFVMQHFHRPIYF